MKNSEHICFNEGKIMDNFICKNIARDNEGNLLFAGVKAEKMADKYGTPLYLMDENRIREKVRTYKKAVKSAFGEKGNVLYASKAASFKRIYEIMKEEEMGIDVVSLGEALTAEKAGFPLRNAYFHSNNKTDEDIRVGIEKGIGYFVVDNIEELLAIEREASMVGYSQKVLLRITPGIDPHTFAAVSTGKVDSKFGSAIETGAADKMVEAALSLKHVKLVGFHCHVGSQVFDSEVFLLTAEVMLKFIAAVKEKYGFVCEKLDLGGGFGVRYLESQPDMDIEANIEEIGFFVRNKCKDLGIEMPEICFEPGRSIVADAGMTVYSVGSVKKIPEFINYVSVDGGMTDNVRYAMYKSKYTVLAAREKDEKKMSCSLAGRCCESGDLVAENVLLPENIKRGDRVAVLTTGAYNYSMASNYNRIPRPPVIIIKDGVDYTAVKRESFEDLLSLDN